MTHHTVGVDISKNRLDAHRLPDGEAARFSNDEAGFEALAAWIGPSAGCVAHEPTGPYHRRFEQALGEAGLPLAKVNPCRARRFAQAAGESAKTDAADARVLAAMAGALKLRPLPPPCKRQRRLRDLQAARSALVNRGAHLADPLLKRQHRAQMNLAARHLDAIDARMRALVAADPALARKAGIIASIPALGERTAAGLLAEMPELGTLSAKAAASLAGLAPAARDSGAFKGRRFIQGGRHAARRLLYMPAVAAMRCNPDMKRTCQALVQRGKPGKVALVAVMRKLLVLANALIQQDRLWTPQHPLNHHA